MSKKLTHNLITILLSTGLLFALILVYKEIMFENQCPKIWDFPACFLVVLFFIVPIETHLDNKGNILFYIFTGIGLSLATFASYGQLFGGVQCPTFGIVPTCFIAFFLFYSSVLLKGILNKKQKTGRVKSLEK